MPKITKKKTTSKVTGTKYVPEMSEVTGSEEVFVPTAMCTDCEPINKLETDFGREDLNIMRDKINELIDKNNECTI